MNREANTPDLLGYLLAYAVADVAFAVILTSYSAVSGHAEFGWLSTTLATAAFVGFCGLPFGAAMIAAIHWTCRRVESQLVHVLVAGLAGMTACVLAASYMIAPWDWSNEQQHWTLGVVMAGGVATALGRAVVIPLVSIRRRPDHLAVFEREQNLV